jgi:hypothetical protein
MVADADPAGEVLAGEGLASASTMRIISDIKDMDN